MRALLIANPAATTTTTRTRDVLLHALQADLDLEVAETTHRGHAAELARARQLDDGYELVITLGGDGTANEAVNGILDRGPGPDRPALAARTRRQHQRLRAGSRHPQRPGRGHRADPGRPARQADPQHRPRHRGRPLVHLLRRPGTGRRRGRRRRAGALGRSAVDPSALRHHGRARVLRRRTGTRPRCGSPVPARSPSRDCTSPSSRTPPRGPTWAVGRSTPRPNASFDTGLDLLGLRGLGTASTLRHVRQLLLGRRPPHGRDVV